MENVDVVNRYRNILHELGKQAITFLIENTQKYDPKI